MFWHNFKYTAKTLLGDKMLIFWTFAFPVILGAFFYMAFSDIEDSEKLHVIDIAVVENTGFRESEMWKESLEALSDEASGEQVFCTKYVSEEEAKRLLSEKEIAGYFMLADGEPQVTVASDGINETVLKYVVVEIYQTEEIVRNTAERRIQQGEMPTAEFYEQLSKEVMNLVDSENGGIRDISGANLSYTMIEFYTLIAMTCLYGGILGMVAEPKSGEYEQQGETGVSKPCGKEPDDPQQRTGRLCDSDGWRSAVVCIYNFCAACGLWESSAPDCAAGIVRRTGWAVRGNCHCGSCKIRR